MATGFRLEYLRRSWHCFAFDQQKPHAMIGGRVAGGGVRGGRCPALFCWMTRVIKDAGENQSDVLDLGRGQLAAVSVCRL